MDKKELFARIEQILDNSPIVTCDAILNAVERVAEETVVCSPRGTYKSVKGTQTYKSAKDRYAEYCQQIVARYLELKAEFPADNYTTLAHRIANEQDKTSQSIITVLKKMGITSGKRGTDNQTTAK